MAELPYPYYRLQAVGPDEKGFGLLIHIEEQAGGPLDGQSMQGVLDELRQRLAGESGTVVTSLTRYEITTTDSP